MGFYYISIFSLILLLVIYGGLLLLWWGIARTTRGMPGRKALLTVVGVVFLILPVGEELWIAYNFEQMCRKDAGISIKKTVEADGFYDDTHGWRADKLRESGFKWVEGRDRTVFERSLWRHEWDGQEIRSFKIDHPTARYHYRWPHSHTPVSYKIKLHEWIVEDVKQQEIVAQEKAYAREAPWFYIGLDRPTMFCPVFGNYGEKLTGGLYRLVLKPSK